MIPPETTNKDKVEMSTAGGPSEETAEAAPDLSALGVREGAGHTVHVKDLHAYYGQMEKHQGDHARVPGERGHRADRAVGLGQVDRRALHQPHARGDSRRTR